MALEFVVTVDEVRRLRTSKPIHPIERVIDRRVHPEEEVRLPSRTNRAGRFQRLRVKNQA